MKSACFSGYRPEKFPFKFDANDGKYLDFEVKLLTVIEEAVNNGYKRFYCGAAYGFDIIAAELTFLVKWLSGKDVKLICVVPFKGLKTVNINSSKLVQNYLNMIQRF